MEKLWWFALGLVIAFAVTMIVHSLFGGIPADATPGDIWRIYGW
jgi:hypothetical protein